MTGSRSIGTCSDVERFRGRSTCPLAALKMDLPGIARPHRVANDGPDLCYVHMHALMVAYAIIVKVAPAIVIIAKLPS